VSDSINLRGLRVVSICGVLPEERERAQPFSLDLDLTVDLSAAGKSDDLADTVNYAAVADLVVAEAARTRCQLLEALTEHLGVAILALDARIEAVEVTIAKLRPPMPHDIATVGVTRRFSRS
jgi:dihydroneopterin aldolase